MRPRSGLAVLFGVALIGVVHVGWAPGAAAAATCNTFDANNAPATAFEGGDKIVVRGTGFAASSVVLVNLQQGNRTIDLARVRANDLGAFSLSNATIPTDVAEGDAAIRALDARASATCAVSLTPGEGDEGSMGGLFLVWGLVLAAFGAILAALTYRRWKAERLREAVDSLALRERFGSRAPDAPVREPVAVTSPAHDVGRSAVQRTDRTSWVRDDDASPWAPDESLPSWVRAPGGQADDIRSTPGSMDQLRDEVSRAWTRDDDTSWTPHDPPLTTHDSRTPEDEPPSPWTAPASDDDASAWSPNPFEPKDTPPSRDVPDRLTQEPIVPGRPPPQRPLPTRPGWSHDDDDDVLAIGAPRPFDDRFAVPDQPQRPIAHDEGGETVVVDEEPDGDPAPFRPAAFDENVVTDRDEASPAPGPAAELEPREDPPAPIEPFPGRTAEPPVVPPSPVAPVAPVVREASEPAHPPVEPARPPVEPAQPPVEPAQPPVEPVRERPPLSRRPPAAPRSAAGVSERDFARALRDFLDREDKDLDRRHPPPRPRPPEPQPPRREPHAPGGPAEASHASPDERIPRAPSRDDDSPWVRPAPADDEHDLFAPPARSEPGRLQPGPIPQAPSRPIPRARQQPPQAPPPAVPVRPGAEPSATEPVRSTRPAPSAWDPQPSRWEDPVGRDPVPPGGRPGGPAPEDPVTEPPVLPVGWDDGRLKPARAASDAIARLRREVRNWREDRST